MHFAALVRIHYFRIGQKTARALHHRTDKEGVNAQKMLWLTSWRPIHYLTKPPYAHIVTDNWSQKIQIERLYQGAQHMRPKAGQQRSCLADARHKTELVAQERL